MRIAPEKIYLKETSRTSGELSPFWFEEIHELEYVRSDMINKAATTELSVGKRIQRKRVKCRAREKLKSETSNGIIAPEIIYLQVEDDDPSEGKEVWGGTIWCQNKINERDVEYVRSDMIDKISMASAPGIVAVVSGSLPSDDEIEALEPYKIFPNNDYYNGYRAGMREGAKWCRNRVGGNDR